MLHTFFQILGFVVGGLFAYFCAGSVAVLITTYIAKRVLDVDWFVMHSYKGHVEWASSHNLVWAPTAVFLMWPIWIPWTVGAFLVSGFFKATEKIGQKLSTLAIEQRKKIGSFRDNPK